ncbi:MAG: hypothetical protein Q7J98_09105 [Kiritimatiellia bacterium]|nr:hypothetical protein [Kiritimatiellia bacterium]
MCGICGKLSLAGKPVPGELIRKMTSALAHRGPDSEGVYLGSRHSDINSAMTVGLGHKRLSIIDLSDAGRQPMANEDKTIWMVFNGEIYNFRSFRDKLEQKGDQFNSRTDGEVIIHLYEEVGIGAVKRLVGMFALAIWDEKKQSLFLGRDHTGIKPLVYCRDRDSFVFASEIKGILQDPDVPREMDWDALNLYLSFLIDEYLSKNGIIRQGIFNYPVIKGLINNLMAGRSDTSWQLWNLIAFQVWHSHYGKT